MKNYTMQPIHCPPPFILSFELSFPFLDRNKLRADTRNNPFLQFPCYSLPAIDYQSTPTSCCGLVPGAFIIPFVLMLITMGLPIFFLELAVGQYSGLGPNEAFKRMAPALEGLGYCTLVVILLVMVYYMVIVAWTLFYTFLSFLPKLSWAYCDNDFNTNRKYTDKITNRPSPSSRV